MIDTRQRLKELENERDRLWAETRLLRERIGRQWEATISRSMPGDVIGRHLALPGLRGFWPMSAFNASGNAQDQSGHGHHLSYVGNPLYGYTGVAPYIQLDGTGDYLNRADESDLDITGSESYVATTARGLTMGGWFRFDNAATAIENALAKWGAAGQRSYRLIRNASGFAQAFISTDGTATVDVEGDTEIAAETWTFLVMRYDPSTELAVFLNGIKTAETTSIPATLHGSTAALRVGGNSSGTELLTGRASFCFLCACALPDATVGKLYTASRALFGV